MTKRLILWMFLLSLIPNFINASDKKDYLMIFRNDSNFNEIALGLGGMTINHLPDSGRIEIIRPDENDIFIPIEAIDSCVVRENIVPTLHLDFPDYPTIHQLWEKDLYLDARLRINGNSLCENTEELQLQVKGRGNSTWGYPKKPMRLKFSKKTSLAGFKKAKNYVLLADYLDPTHVRNVLALWLARRLGIPYTNHTMPCNVVVNGENQGLYLLTEKVGVNAGSVDIDETVGILFELSTEFDEKYKFRSARYDLPVMVKDPDFDELYADNPDGLTPEERLALWQNDFSAAEDSVYNRHPFTAFDLQSVVNFYLVNLFCDNSDIGHPKSFYMWKERPGNDCKYKFGPVWDFDGTTFNMPTLVDGELTYRSPDDTLWENRLMYAMTVLPEFKMTLHEKIVEFCDVIAPELLLFLDEYATMIEPSALADGVLWPDQTDYRWICRLPSSGFRDDIPRLRQWIVDRVEFLRTNY